MCGMWPMQGGNSMSSYDGTWENDPLDLRCIRLDAELEEARHYGDKPLPKCETLMDVYKLKEEDPDEYDTYMVSTCPPGRTGKKFYPCIILDEKLNVVDEDCRDPVVAHKKILELSIINDKLMADYSIFLLREMKFVCFQRVEEYE